MSDTTAVWLIDRIRAGDPRAWQDLIDAYEGRLCAFVRMRLSDRDAVDDVVQETLMGLLRSLPHYDSSRDLESYLFTIAAHKIRDHLRKNGRHPLGLLGDLQESGAPAEPSARVRGPSSLLASRERLDGEEARLVALLSEMLGQWLAKGDYRRVKCMELLFVAGWSNQEVSQELGLSEQQVANYKFQMIERLTRGVQSDSKGE
ncbi:sigma-70 family RNA polymerase sigma factor [bacterium]|jgi:RNA polymerase sigma-70 factor, ECF subfamily|nr:sigma-70 family RNA polymerase sigma factor [bacterium]